MRRATVAGLAFLAIASGLLLWRSATHRQARAPGSRAEAEPVSRVAEAPAPAPEAEDVDILASVDDERGLTLSNADGTVRFTVDGESVPVEAEISDGTWRWTVRKGSSLTFETIEFGGRSAVPITTTMEVPNSGVMEIRCRWLVPTRLRVIGERGQDLDGLEIVETDTYVEIAPPADADRVVVGGTSPVELNGAEDARTFWVRAPGYAWSRIMVSVGFGGERVVRLVPGGALHVRLTPFDPDSEVAVHVIRGDEIIDEELSVEPDETGELGIQSLPAGALRVEAYSDTWGDPHRLASAEVRIEAGKTTQLTLALGEIPSPPDLVPLEGTYRVDPAWPSQEDDSVGFCATGAPTPLSVVPAVGDRLAPDATLDEEEGTWSAGLVPPGRYYLLLGDWSYALAVDAGPRGNTEARIVVPPPCDVEVRLVDAETGEAIPDEHELAWSVKSPEVGPDFGRTWIYCEREESPARPGVYRFRAPVGTLLVAFWSDLHRAEEVEVPLKPGLNRIDLKTTWNLGVDLALRDGAMPVPVDSPFTEKVEARRLDGEGELDWCGNGDPCSLRVTKPGRYRVTFPAAIEGYEPIAPIEVEVVKGVIPKVEVLLTRESR